MINNSTFTKEHIPDETLDSVEDLLGMSQGGWDTIDGKEIIAAAWTVLFTSLNEFTREAGKKNG